MFESAYQSVNNHPRNECVANCSDRHREKSAFRFRYGLPRHGYVPWKARPTKYEMAAGVIHRTVFCSESRNNSGNYARTETRADVWCGHD